LIDKTLQKLDSFIQRVEAEKIVAWIATGTTQASVDIKFHLDTIELGSVHLNVAQCIHKEILNGVEGCWFECYFDPMLLLDRYSKEKEMRISLEGRSIGLEYTLSHFSLFLEEWLEESLSFLFIKKNFLHFFILFGSGIEKKLSVCQLCQAILWLKFYRLFETQSDKSKILLSTLQIKVEEESENRCLYTLLIENDNLLEYFIQNRDILHTQNIQRVLKDVLLSLSPKRSKYLVSHNNYSQKIFYDIEEKIEDALKRENEWYALLKSPNQILSQWNTFSAEERIVQTLPFLSLLFHLKLFDKMTSLDIKREEWREVFYLDSEQEPEELCQMLFSVGKTEEALLCAVYFLSVGCSVQCVVSVINLLITEEMLCFLDDMSLYQWLFLKKLLVSETISFYEQKKIVEEFTAFVEKNDLWSYESVSIIYHTYLNRLLQSRDEMFLPNYTLYMKHYLLDGRVSLKAHLCTVQYLEETECSWLKSVEEIRKKAIACLGRRGEEKRLLGYLALISYFSPERVREIAYSIYRNRLNLDQHQEVLEDSAFSLLEIGGNYDKLQASRFLKDTALFAHYERELISHTKKWISKSSNNYWYHRALTVRNSTEERRLAFLSALFGYILKEENTDSSHSRLIRLLISEIIWNLEKGMHLEECLLEGFTIESILEKCLELNKLSASYIEMFTFYRYLSSLEVNQEKICFFELIHNEQQSTTYSYSVIQMLQKVLKLESESELNLHQAKIHIKEAMLYPYTLILIYSCQAYQNTRQQVIRDTWLLRAKELGISYKFVVGESDVSKIENDMICLEVKDSYEYLPQKTVEMFHFVSKAFSFDYFMKIDDDCFVNIDAFFSDDLLFTTQYYGRYVYRGIGDTDRVWHQKKSQTKKAREEIDLSPEPSYYADGSTGYVLSHDACHVLYQAYRLKKNETLIKHSYLEDKLVGDLLAQQNIPLESGNFTSVVYRKVTKQQEVAFWEYNLFPRFQNEMKVLHCETKEKMQYVWKYFFDTKMQKVQPEFFSDHPINHFLDSYDTQAFLEEVTIRRDALHEAKYIAVFIAKDESKKLFDFLDYHRKLGIEHFIYIDNASEDTSLEFMQKEEDVSIFITTQIYENFHSGLDWLQTVYKHFCYGKWILTLDVHERFLLSNQKEQKLSTLISQAEREGYDAFESMLYEVKHFSSLDISSIDFQRISSLQESLERLLSLGSVQKPLHFKTKRVYRLFKYNPNQKIRENFSSVEPISSSCHKTFLAHL